MQSFSVKTKTELCRTHAVCNTCHLAELYGMLLFAPVFGHRGVRLAAEQQTLMRRTAMLFEQALHIGVMPKREGRKWVIQLTDERALRQLFHGLGYDHKSHLIYHLNRNLVESECCAMAFLRGAFFMSGSLAGPDKKAHLEITTAHATLCRETVSLLQEYNLAPKTTDRGRIYMMYWKDSEAIGEFLTKIGAFRAMTALLEGKVERQMRGEINRQVNCVAANSDRVAQASARQILAIERALQVGGLEIFPEKLRETVDLRVAYPTDSLAELALRFTPPISKPGLSHRLKKIVDIAQYIIEKEGQA